MRKSMKMFMCAGIIACLVLGSAMTSMAETSQEAETQDAESQAENTDQSSF